MKVRCSVCHVPLVYEELTRGKRQRVRDNKNVVCSDKCRLAVLRGPKKRHNMYGATTVKVYQKLWLKHHPERRILHQIRSKARKTGVKFNLTVEDIVIPAVCPVFGFRFNKHNKLLTTSVDRKNNRRGYVKGNIHIISGLANVMKNKATPAQLLRFAEWIIKCYGPIKTTA